MEASATGAVVINSRIAENLLSAVQHTIEKVLGSRPAIASIDLQTPPVVLCRDITIDSGIRLIGQLAGLGLAATFLPSQTLPAPAETPLPEPAPAAVPAASAAPAGRDSLPEIEQWRQEEQRWRDDGSAATKTIPVRNRLLAAVMEANKELWIILSMVAIAALINFAVASQYLLLGLYSLPTVMAAFFFGRRQAVMTAFASLLTVCLVAYFSPALFKDNLAASLGAGSRWYHIVSWGCILMVTAYAMGTLYERNRQKVQELRDTYQGLLLILRHFISQDEYTENHCYRVSIYAAKIASCLGLDEEYIQDVRSAALLHDIGKLKVSREILYKAARLSQEDRKNIEKHVDTSAGILEPMRGPLGRILPMILGHHDKFDGSGYRDFAGQDIPLGARILAVADVYDALVSDRPYRKAMSPFAVKEIIVKGKGKEFDPAVVEAFVLAFDRREMEVPNVIV